MRNASKITCWIRFILNLGKNGARCTSGASEKPFTAGKMAIRFLQLRVSALRINSANGVIESVTKLGYQSDLKLWYQPIIQNFPEISCRYIQVPPGGPCPPPWRFRGSGRVRRRTELMLMGDRTDRHQPTKNAESGRAASRRGFETASWGACKREAWRRPHAHLAGLWGSFSGD